MPARRRSCLSL